MTTAAAASLFWIAIGAFALPMIARRLRAPSAVGEILYGVALGPSVLKLISQSDFTDLMAQIGFAILMFSAGMEIDFAPLRKRGSKTLGTAVIWTILAAGASVALALYLGIGPWPTLAVCAVSIGLASVLLREKRLLPEPIGQVTLAVGLIGETLSILALTVLDFRAKYPEPAMFAMAIGKFAGIFILAYLLIRVFRFIIWWAPEKVESVLAGADPLELGVRLSVALLFIFVALSAYVEVEPILGAFLAGAMFGFIFQEREVVAEKINAMGQGFFVPFFFIVVGTHFNPFATLKSIRWEELGVLALLALSVKVFPSLAFLRVGLKLREVLAAGLLLAAPLTLTVAVAEVGASLAESAHQAGHGDAGIGVSAEMQGSLLLMAIIMGLVCPFLARLLLPDKAEAAPDPRREKAAS